jgi:putative pyruvate formate lyase activating enzyme
MSVNNLTLKKIYDQNDIKLLSNCTLCPRECKVDRFKGGTGYCRADAGTNIASICIHRGEEPSISGPDGICNIFFSGCNLRCIYCQNHEISRPGAECRSNSIAFHEALNIITGILDRGIKAVGFVSPSHVVPQVKAIIKVLNLRGYKPKTVYNTNSYDKKETINNFEGMIDVYLPDYKYITPDTARELSDAIDYPLVAREAIREMYHQRGSVLATDEEGRAERGILIRHLVLPGHAEESKKVLKTIAEEISTGVSISLMSQYHPTQWVASHEDLGRTLYKSEYQEVVEAMEYLGFRNGWVQDMDSHQNYRPDFRKENPFE